MRINTKQDLEKSFVFSNPRTVPFEANDCSVRAFTHALNIPYIEAWELLTKAGRKLQKGIKTSDLMPKFGDGVKDVTGYFGPIREEYCNGCNVTHRMLELRKAPKLEKVLPMLSYGTFFVMTPGHVFTVKDGKVWDSFLDNQIVLNVFQVLDPKKALDNFKNSFKIDSGLGKSEERKG